MERLNGKCVIALHRKVSAVDDIPLIDVFLIVSSNETAGRKPFLKIIASYPIDLSEKLEGVNLVRIKTKCVGIYMFSRANS